MYILIDLSKNSFQCVIHSNAAVSTLPVRNMVLIGAIIEKLSYALVVHPRRYGLRRIQKFVNFDEANALEYGGGASSVTTETFSPTLCCIIVAYGYCIIMSIV